MAKQLRQMEAAISTPGNRFVRKINIQNSGTLAHKLYETLDRISFETDHIKTAAQIPGKAYKRFTGLVDSDNNYLAFRILFICQNLR